MTLSKRIIDISYKNKLSHLGSCLTAVDLIDAVYAVKSKDDKFVLSCGHAALALYVVLEKYFNIDAEFLIKYSGVHPDRISTMTKDGSPIDCSTGSLGQGLPVAVGMALANRSRRIFCLISDGECSEGSIWEALRVAHELKLKNLVVIANINGYAAYKEVDGLELYDRFNAFGWEVKIVEDYKNSNIRKLLSQKNSSPTLIYARTDVEKYPFLKGLDAHYHVMSEEEYAETR
jgi:transketolase